MPLPTFLQSDALETARNAEYTGTPFTDIPGDGTTADPYLGCNAAGSCAPGIGIATGVADVQSSWTVPDQFGVARNPQNSQHIGQTASVINTVDGADVNDTVALTDLAVGWVDTAVA